MRPVTVSVSAPVILSVLRDGEQDDRYRKSGKNGHRQPAGVIPHDSGFIPRIHSIRAPLSHSSDFHPCTSFEQHISPIFIGRAPFFRFQIGFSAKKACFISQETESCRRLCWGSSRSKALCSMATLPSSVSTDSSLGMAVRILVTFIDPMVTSPRSNGNFS